MQTQLFESPDDLDYFTTLKEYIPFLDQAINGNFSMDSSLTNQDLISSFLRKCLTELKECKTTLAIQEDTIQAATDELLNLREENNQLSEANQSLTNKISDLKQYLSESDTIAISLRSEINNLRQENRVLAEAVNNANTTSKDESVIILPEQFEQGIVKEAESDSMIEKEIDQSLIINALQQRDNTIKNLTQNVEELTGFKERYDQLLKENEAQRSLKEFNRKLQEELLAIKEENKGLLKRSPDMTLRKLRSLEVFDNSDKVQATQSESDTIFSFNIKDEDCHNKNFLARKSMSLASPSKENVDIKKQSLLMETILFNSTTKSPITPLQKKNSENLKKPNQRNMALVNFGGILKTNLKNLPGSLTEAHSIEESDSSEQSKRQIKPNHDFSLSLYSSREGQNNRKDKNNISARRHDDRVYLRESSFEAPVNTSRNSEEYCFEEMMSWEEGDFPRLNTSNLTCGSAHIEPQYEEKWITKSDIETKEMFLIPKDQKDHGFKINLQDMTPVDQNTIKQNELNISVIKENRTISQCEQNERNEEAESKLTNEISVNNVDINNVSQKMSQIVAEDNLVADRLKERMTQTDSIETFTANNIIVNRKYLNQGLIQNRWRNYFSLISVLFSLLFIFLTCRGDCDSQSEL